MGLFFISVGSQFDWHVILDETFFVSLLTLGLILGKGVAIGIITALAGYSRGIAIRAGILLGQGSEFGFALLAVALATGLLELGLSQPIIASIILSMAISPMLIRYGEAIACRFAPDYADSLKQAEARIEEASRDLTGHVLLCGFGRTAQNLAHFLRRSGIPFIALEANPDIVTEAREVGERVFLADASNFEILRLAGIDRARVLVVSFTEYAPAERIVRAVREVNSDIPLLVRTRDDRHLEDLLECGADEVIPDTVESSMMLARHTLELLDQTPQSIDDLLGEARQDNYARIRAFFHGDTTVNLESPDKHHLRSIEVLDSCWGVGRALGSIDSLSRIKVISLRRNGIACDDPEHDTPLEANDVLVVEGHPNDIQAAEIEIMSGR
jgi:CPA2 family monovalent cation:H+ antiporter-2